MLSSVEQAAQVVIESPSLEVCNRNGDVALKNMEGYSLVVGLAVLGYWLNLDIFATKIIRQFCSFNISESTSHTESTRTEST